VAVRSETEAALTATAAPPPGVAAPIAPEAGAERGAIFRHRLLPYLLVAPQLLVTLVFFIWPAGRAVYQSVLLEDPFGLGTEFVGAANFQALLGDPLYLHAIWVTLVFSSSVTALALAAALLLAVMADRVIRGATTYRTLLIWPYAVAPAVAGVLWLFMFNPTIGVVAYALRAWLGYDWNYLLNGNQAMFLVVIAAAWKQVSYNFLFFLAGLQAIPRSLIEAAAIDGAGPAKRFWTIMLPLLGPTAFFLIVVNIVYAFFDTFGIIHAVTGGGPARATEILVFKVFRDGFIGLDLGGSAAQSVILMLTVGALTIVQFRYIERRIHYG
jgi:sn-glycerol 3-phosphate transport system permease protein